MSSSLPDKLFSRVEFRLVAWFCAGFIVLSLLLFAFISLQLIASIGLKQRQFLLEMASHYGDIASDQGVESLVKHLGSEPGEPFRNWSFILIQDRDGSVSYVSLPESWEAVSPAGIIEEFRKQKGKWRKVRGRGWFRGEEKADWDDLLEISSSKIAGGCILYFGFSSEEVQETLSRLLDLFLKFLIFTLGIALLGGIFFTWRSLVPLKGLLAAVQKVESGRLDARVACRGSGDDLDKLAGRFNTMLSKIERLITAMGESLDNLSHDLKTPLARMRVTIEKAVGDDGTREQMLNALLDCGEETEALDRTINALMDISEAETGTMTLNPEKISLNRLIESLCDVYQLPAGEKEVLLVPRVAEGLEITADAPRLYQLMANLVDNGVKYTPSHGTVTITAGKTDGGVIITVEDTGPGIPEEEMPRIFERLYRGDKSRSEKGLGLGLALVQAVVRAHRGEISVTNLEPGGTCFAVTLPNPRHNS